MSFELKHFRGSDRIIAEKGLDQVVDETLRYVDDVLHGSLYRGSYLKSALEDMGWREDGTLTIIEGRRYQLKGFHRRVGIEASLVFYEGIWEALFRLQVGLDKGLIDAGTVILNGKRSERSPLGTPAELVESEIEALHPTINLPVAVAIYDFGTPVLAEEEQA